MSFMKKHPFILFEFHSSVKLKSSESAKIHKWLGMASLVMGELITEKKLIHPGWLKQASSIRVSLLLCGEAKIRKLNREHRDKDYVTDVLSFPSFESLRKPPNKDDFLSSEIFLGDLAICHQKTIKQAKQFDISYWDEFIHLTMHGMIHLMGYDHEISAKEEKLMESWENKALTRFSDIKKGAR